MEPEHADLQTFADKLINKLNLTRDARFAGHRRLMRRHQLSISMLSLYVIEASIIPIFMKSLTDNSKALLAGVGTVQRQIPDGGLDSRLALESDGHGIN